MIARPGRRGVRPGPRAEERPLVRPLVRPDVDWSPVALPVSRGVTTTVFFGSSADDPPPGPERPSDALHHPLRAAEHEVEHLLDIVEEGESDATLPILIGTWVAAVVVLVVVLVALALLVAHFVG